ncbi:LysR family transcriptional regulator [Phaeobacter sp.]|uniref:LysR family transcriptional regulator n=1 Tax=Phaeobacter sp. TaxID=1902409 RepID=UPI0025EF0AAA|nr:LysR family transcriptional regulator [Phaeobacter sp.]
MALKIELLRGFAVVARSGNLSDAADILGRTPSAVSMMLKQLEAHLGEPLFETDRKNKLTALGAYVLEQAERELQQFDNMVKAIEGYANATHGHVRIATVPSVAGSIMPLVVSKYITDLSNIDIELRDMDSNSILHELSRNRIDIGIATMGENSAGLYSRHLLSDAFGVICAPSHPLANDSGPVAWAELQDARLIANSLSAGITAPASKALHDRALLTAQNLTSIIAMVHAEIGITILPEMAARAANATGLVFRPLADTLAKRQIHLLRKRDAALSPAARMIEHHIVTCTADMMQGSAA